MASHPRIARPVTFAFPAFALPALAVLAIGFISPAFAQKGPLAPIRPGLYSFGQYGGCGDPDGMDHLYMDKTELHQYENHCKIRSVKPLSASYLLKMECESEGVFSPLIYEITPQPPDMLIVRTRDSDKPTSKAGDPMTYHFCPAGSPRTEAK